MTPDATRWVWTPNGMEPYRAHPLLMDVGGVFVSAEDYEQLRSARNNPVGSDADRKSWPIIPLHEIDNHPIDQMT